MCLSRDDEFKELSLFLLKSLGHPGDGECTFFYRKISFLDFFLFYRHYMWFLGEGLYHPLPSLLCPPLSFLPFLLFEIWITPTCLQICAILMKGLLIRFAEHVPWFPFSIDFPYFSWHENLLCFGRRISYYHLCFTTFSNVQGLHGTVFVIMQLDRSDLEHLQVHTIEELKEL